MHAQGSSHAAGDLLQRRMRIGLAVALLASVAACSPTTPAVDEKAAASQDQQAETAKLTAFLDAIFEEQIHMSP